MTLAEVLKKSGWTDEQIAALDAKAMSGLTDYVNTAEQAAVKAETDRKAAEASEVAAKAAQEAAELQKRSVDEFWKDTYNPGMAAWEKERQELAKKASDAEAKAAYYEKQRESYLGTLGIKPEDAPTFVPPVNNTVVDPNKTPGTPTFVEPNVIVGRIGDGMNTINDIMYKHQVLYNKPLPIPPSQLIANADALKLSPMEYAARTFKFAEKEAEMRQAEAKAHDDAIAAAAVAASEVKYKEETDRLKAEFNAKEKLRAEQGGSNPDVKLPPGSARFADLQRATKAGERPDPLKMTPQERKQTTLNNIHKALEERETAAA
jgi:hypothetical protein